jgi:hypothetical protein
MAQGFAAASESESVHGVSLAAGVVGQEMIGFPFRTPRVQKDWPRQAEGFPKLQRSPSRTQFPSVGIGVHFPESQKLPRLHSASLAQAPQAPALQTSPVSHSELAEQAAQAPALQTWPAEQSAFLVQAGVAGAHAPLWQSSPAPHSAAELQAPQDPFGLHT